MAPKSQKKTNLFHEISDFWSLQLNNEIYLRKHRDLVRGSKEYFETILASRRRYIYYFSLMISYLQHSPSRNLLEVGCGMGTDTLVFARRGFDTTGVDLAPGHLRLAKRLFEHYGLKGRFIEGNAEELPFDDDAFGCIYSYGVLHHTPNTKRAIQEIYRVLVPEGRAVIMLYHKWSLNNFVHCITRRGFENVKGSQDTPVTRRFSRKEVQELCSEFRQSAISCEYLYGAGWGKVYDRTPMWIYSTLSKWIGWHLVIYLKK